MLPFHRPPVRRGPNRSAADLVLLAVLLLALSVPVGRGLLSRHWVAVTLGPHVVYFDPVPRTRHWVHEGVHRRQFRERGVWRMAPYLVDGSARSSIEIEAVAAEDCVAALGTVLGKAPRVPYVVPFAFRAAVNRRSGRETYYRPVPEEMLSGGRRCDWQVRGITGRPPCSFLVADEDVAAALAFAWLRTRGSGPRSLRALGRYLARTRDAGAAAYHAVAAEAGLRLCGRGPGPGSVRRSPSAPAGRR